MVGSIKIIRQEDNERLDVGESELYILKNNCSFIVTVIIKHKERYVVNVERSN